MRTSTGWTVFALVAVFTFACIDVRADPMFSIAVIVVGSFGYWRALVNAKRE